MKHYKVILFLTAIIAAIITLNACDSVTKSDGINDEIMSKGIIDENANSSLTGRGAGNQNIQAYLTAAASVIMEAVEDESFRKELSFAFDEVKKVENRFDAISFAELESPKAFYKKELEDVKGIQIASEKTMMAAYRIVKNRTPGMNINSLRKFLLTDRANIYMPNSDIWDGRDIPTVSWHPLDEHESENIGYKPVKDKSGKLTWEEVLVNEEYGETNPVLIILPGESYAYEPYSIQSSDCFIVNGEFELIDDPCYDDGGDDGGSTPPPSSQEYLADCDNTDCAEAMEMLVGWVELNHYPCGWFCSGRRIYFGHQIAYYNFIDSPLIIENPEPQTSVWMRSGDRGSWVRYYTHMDSNWAQWQLSKPLSIWIGRGGSWKRLIQGAYKIITGDGNYLDIIYDTYLDMTSDSYSRDVFMEGVLDRGTFIAGNTSSFGHGTREGYRVRRVDNGTGSHIRFTLPHMIYTY